MNIFSTDNKVVVISGRTCKDEDGKDDIETSVNVEVGAVILVPGDHQDGGLENDLEGRFGKYTQAIQYPRPGGRWRNMNNDN